MNISRITETPSVRRKKAAEWLVELQNPELAADEIFEWEIWLAEDKLNRRAFDEAERLAQRILAIKDDLGDITIPSQTEIENDEYDGLVTVADWMGGEVANRSEQERPGRVSRPYRSWPLAMAASITVIAVAAGLLFRSDLLPFTTPDQIESYQTVSSEHRNVVLSDGSEIVVGAMSLLSVNFTSDRRTVVLEKGEALFTVAKNSRRPFVVVAASGSITAIGTAFNVRRDDGRVVVTVTHGTVEFNRTKIDSDDAVMASHQMSSAPETLQLTAGQQAIYNSRGLNIASIQDPVAVTTWQSGRLQYRAEPLKYVVAGVNRYSQREITIGDSSVEDMVFTGSVFQDQTEEWLAGLEEVFPIEVVPMGNEKVLLRKRQKLSF